MVASFMKINLIVLFSALLSLCPALHGFQALSSESVERLPVFNKSALRHYQTSIEADDWSIPSSEPKKLGKYDYSVPDVRTESRVK